MKTTKIPFQKTLFVCTNTREGGRVACGNPGRGGEELCEELKAYIKEAGLKGKVRVARSGCLDLCEKGPNVFVYPDGEWLSDVQHESIPEIIQRINDRDSRTP